MMNSSRVMPLLLLVVFIGTLFMYVFVENNYGAVVQVYFPDPVYNNNTTDEQNQDLNTANQISEDLISIHKNVDFIVYNRVPKTGSSTIWGVINQLSKKNTKFRMHFSTIFTQHNVSRAEQLAALRVMYRMKPPAVYNRHIHFLNFTELNKTMPVYINVVREPLERLASWYYFIRFEHRRKMNDSRRNMRFDDCVAKDDPECVHHENYFRQIPFFCGQQEICRIPGEAALAQAKRNVEQYYAVVGTNDDISDFFRVLEYRIPDFFKGAMATYLESGRKMRTRKKQPILSETRSKMAGLLKYDYDFYHFVKQRLANQVLLLNQTTLSLDMH